MNTHVLSFLLSGATARYLLQCLKIMLLAFSVLTASIGQSQAQQLLTADQISTQIIGHRFQGRKGIMSVTVHYAQDGSMSMQTPLGAGEGGWTVSGNQLCVTLISGPRKGAECLTFIRLPDGRYQGSNGVRLTLIQ